MQVELILASVTPSVCAIIRVCDDHDGYDDDTDGDDGDDEDS